MNIPNIPLYSQSKRMKKFVFHTNRKVLASQGYFQVRLVDMRISRDFVGANILTPAIHSLFVTGDNVTETLLSNIPLKDVREDNRKTYFDQQSLSPVIPYNGNSMNFQLSLVSIPSRDLVAEVLEILTTLIGPTQRPELVMALGITGWLRKGINALLGMDGIQLLLKWSGELGHEGYVRESYTVITTPDAPINASGLTIKNNRLLYNNREVDHANYLLASVRVTDSRPDWHTLPEIRPHFDYWNNKRSVFNVPVHEYNQAVSQLLIALRTSPNLVPFDAERIVRSELKPLFDLGDEAQASLIRSAGFSTHELPDEVTPQELPQEEIVEVTESIIE